MTLLTVLLAVAAVLLALPGSPTTGRLTGGPAVRPQRPPGWRRGLRRVAVVVTVAAGLGGVLAVGGIRATVFATGTGLVLATSARLLVLSRRRRRAVEARRSVVEAAEVLAANLRVGMVPTVALRAAAASCPVLVAAEAASSMGAAVPEVLRRQAEQDGQLGLRDLARAWEVASVSGASLTGTLEQVAAGLTADQSLQAVVGGELAAPRATGKLMAALPALGIAMGYLIGGDPLRWLTAGPTGWACLLAGVTLACAGVLWIEALARRASDQG